MFQAVVLKAGGKQLRELYRHTVQGRPLVLATQTVAELRFGAAFGEWSQQRRDALERQVAHVQVAPVDTNLIDAYVDLRVECKRANHPLGQKFQHEQDRWIAATARLYGLPLIAHDGVFFDVPDLQLITHLPRQ